METATLERPQALESRQATSSEEFAAKLGKVIRGAQGRDMVDGNIPVTLLASQFNADDAAAIAPLAFNQKIAAYLLGEGHEQVLDQTFTHVVEYVAMTTDPGSRQSFVALLTNPIVAKQIWGTGYKKHIREVAAIVAEDLEQGQKHASRNGNGRR